MTREQQENLDHIRTEINSLDNSCCNTLDSIEYDNVDLLEDIELAEDLKEKIEDLKNLITELQESQNWI